MPATTSCVDCCTTPQTVDIPGSPGATGSAGTNGINAFTTTAANFLTPALGNSVTIQVVNSQWMVVGQALVAADGTADGGTYLVTSVPDSTHVVATYLNYGTNTNAGVVVNSGAGVSPGGLQTPATSPLPIANGGTNATTKAGAQTALGLGQNAQISNVTGLAQNILAAGFVQVGTISVTIPAAGEWLWRGFVTVVWNGVTFAGGNTLQLRLRNITQGTNIALGSWTPPAVTTLTFPASDLHIPITLDATAIAADVYQLLIQSTPATNTAGTFNVVAGSLAAIPLRLS